MRMRAASICLCLLHVTVACSSSRPPLRAEAPQPGTSALAQSNDPQPVFDFGTGGPRCEPMCAADDRCVAADRSSPPFWHCLHKCTTDADCADGLHCHCPTDGCTRMNYCSGTDDLLICTVEPVKPPGVESYRFLATLGLCKPPEEPFEPVGF